MDHSANGCASCGRDLREEQYCPHCGTQTSNEIPATSNRFCACCGAARNEGESATASEWMRWSETISTAVSVLPDLAFLALWIDGGGECPINDGASYQVEIRRLGDKVELRATANSQLLPGLRYDPVTVKEWNDPDQPGRRLRWGPTTFDEAGVEETVAAVIRMVRGPFRARSPKDVYFESSADSAIALLDSVQVLKPDALGVEVLEEDLLVVPALEAAVAEIAAAGGRVIRDSTDGIAVLRFHDSGYETISIQTRPTRSISITWPALPADRQPPPESITSALDSSIRAFAEVDSSLRLVAEMRFGGLVFDGVSLVRHLGDGEDTVAVLRGLVSNADRFLDSQALSRLGAQRGDEVPL